MINKNDVMEVTIQAAASEGEGIAKVDGYAVFVPGVAVGDRLKIKILKVGKSFAHAKTLEIISPSPARANPPCPVYQKCGGCNLMHLSYPAQLDFKRQKVADAIQRIGGFSDVKIEAVKPMENTFHYRNKAQLPVGEKIGKPIAGFYAPRSHRIVETQKCYLQHESSEIVKNTVLDWMERFNIEPYNEHSHSGIIRHIYTRVGYVSGQVMVSIVSTSKYLPHEGDLVRALRNMDMEGLTIKSIVHNINPDKTNVVLGRTTRVLYGNDYIIDEMDGLKFKISHNSFYQVNPVMTKEIYEKTAQLIGNIESKDMFDIYCGIGTISLYLARRARSVIGIEWVNEAVCDAKYNAAENNIKNAKFYAGDASEVIKDLYKSGISADAVVIDPPRKGCERSIINTLCQMGSEKIVYVSCNPATLARDLKYFSEGGYFFDTVYPFDQFPHTSHVETVVLITRVKD